MIQNYLKVALRNVFKDRLHAVINIAGLTIGLTSFMLISLYLQYELSYETHHEKADRIYRISMRQKGNDFRGSDRFAVTPMPLAPAMKEKFPEVEAATTLQTQRSLLAHQEKVFNEPGLFADEQVFDIFTFPVIQGAGAEALTDPGNILLTRSLAEKFFSDENPIGKTLLFENERLLTVRGVLEDVPTNQHFTFNYLTSVKNLPYYNSDIGRWNSNNYRTYITLGSHYDYRDLEAKMNVFDKDLDAAYQNVPFEPSFFLQPLLDIHLHSRINLEMGANGDIRYIYLFISIAFIILILASINYMNLATARSVRRAKEVGVRKVLGARRRQLVLQFLAESFLLTIISFLAAIALVDVVLPLYSRILDKDIPFHIIGNQLIFVGMIVAALVLGGLSGLYPALFLSGVKPVKAFRGGFLKSHKEGALLRNFLVTGQFTTAIILAIGSIVVFQQLQYIQNKKLGFSRDQVVYIPFGQPEVSRKISVIREKLLAIPKVEKVSIATVLPLNSYNQGVVDQWEGNEDQKEIWIYRNYVDENFFDLFEMEIIAGRAFSQDHPTDSIGAYVLNEAAVKALGWDSPIGKQFRDGQVIGVVKDFHFQPFNLAIEPLFLRYRQRQNTSNGNIIMKLQAGDIEGTIAGVQATMRETMPRIPFDIQFLDDSYNQLYRAEKRLGQTFGIFTFLALFIACMGLFGLVSHSVVQRTREIGIRKVLGASVPNIVELLSKDFLKLVMLALMLGAPIAWYLTRQWLQNFVYRVELHWSVFVLVGVLAVVLAFLTISVQSLKAALANPVHSLRTE